MTAESARAPFLSVYSFEGESAPAELPPAISSTPARSPFLSVYEAESESTHADPVREAVATLLERLHDEEFDEAVFELQCRGRAVHDEQLAMGRPREEADRLVMQYYAPLQQASEAMVDAVSSEFAPRELAGIAEREIDSFVEAYATLNGLDPEFEQFVGKLLGKVGGFVKAAAGTAWQGLKQLGLGPILAQIKRAVRAILKRVLNWAIGRLPIPLQPVAEQLAQKLGLRAAPKPAAGADAAADPASAPAVAPDSAGAPVQPAAGTDDAATPQQELDQRMVAALLAQNELELEAEGAGSAAAPAVPTFAELDDARERFITGLQSLGADESAAPQIQQFLPALLPALRLGIRLIGRPRVVSFLAQALAGLIKKLIGPEHADALSRAIADAGLKLMSLELSEAEGARVAPAAVAATVEETVARIASLPDEVLDNQELLEGYTLEAFEQSAAANLPALFSQATYERRPELLEAGVNAGWVLLPLRGPKRYKRCTRSFHVSVSPHLAEEVESFDGATLAEHLQDQFGLEEGEQVDAQMHLYEALPGSTLVDIARGERETLGVGLADEANAGQLHPLTPQAATALIGRPAFGRTLLFDAPGRQLAAGQRLYHLSLGRRPLLVLGRRHRLHQLLRLNLVLDDVQDQVRVCVVVSEVRAQKLAARLRQATNSGAISAGFQRAIGRRLLRILRGFAPRRLRIVHAAMPPGLTTLHALRNLPPAASEAFVAKLQAWLVQAFAEFITTQAPRVIAATEDPAQGITFVFTLEHPPGLKALGRALVERGASGSAIADAIVKGPPPAVRVDVHAGHRDA
jgi:hypothetical protein